MDVWGNPRQIIADIWPGFSNAHAEKFLCVIKVAAFPKFHELGLECVHHLFVLAEEQHIINIYHNDYGSFCSTVYKDTGIGDDLPAAEFH